MLWSSSARLATTEKHMPPNDAPLQHTQMVYSHNPGQPKTLRGPFQQVQVPRCVALPETTSIAPFLIANSRLADDEQQLN